MLRAHVEKSPCESINSTFMCHDISLGTIGAASNVFALLLSVHLIGSALDDRALDALHGRIAFGFFQGESYGYVSSRRFLRDVLDGFVCDGGGQ